MSKQFNTNIIEDDEFDLNNDESDYKNLITRLKEISVTIALLKKITLDKF